METLSSDNDSNAQDHEPDIHHKRAAMTTESVRGAGDTISAHSRHLDGPHSRSGSVVTSALTKFEILDAGSNLRTVPPSVTPEPWNDTQEINIQQGGEFKTQAGPRKASRRPSISSTISRRRSVSTVRSPRRASASQRSKSSLRPSSHQPRLLPLRPFREIPPTYEQVMLEKNMAKIPLNTEGMPAIVNPVVRIDELRRIRDFFLSSRANKKILVLWGPWGIGKTHLATSFMMMYKDEFSALFFLKGDSETSLNASMAHILDQIWTSWSVNDGRPNTRPTDPDMVIRATRKWFSIPRNCDWLLVIDGADTLDAEVLNKYIPQIDQGAVLITTKDQDLGNGLFRTAIGELRPVPRLTLEEADSLLAKRESISGDSVIDGIDISSTTPLRIPREYANPLTEVAKPPDEGRKALLEELDGLAIAVESVGSRIRNTRISYEEMLRIFKSDLDSTGAVDSELYALFTDMWNQLFYPSGTVNEANENAARLLLVMSFLDPREIWYELLECGQADPSTPSWFRKIVKTKEAFTETLKILLSFGFVRVDAAKTEVYTMHNLHQKACRRLAVDQDPQQYYGLALSCVGWSSPHSLHPHVGKIKRRLVPHVEQIKACLLPYLREGHYFPTGFLFESLTEDQQRTITRFQEQSTGGLRIAHPTRYWNSLEKLASLGTIECTAIWEAADSGLQESSDRFLRFDIKLSLAICYAATENTKAARILVEYLQSQVGELYSDRGMEDLWLQVMLIELDVRDHPEDPEITARTTALMNQIRDSLNEDSMLYWDFMEQLVLIQFRLGHAAEFRRFSQDLFFYLGRLTKSFSHPMVFHTASYIGAINFEELDLARNDSILYHERVCQGYEIALGESHPETIATLQNLEWIYDNADGPHLEGRIRVRRKILEALSQRPIGDLDSRIERARLFKNLAGDLIEQASTDNSTTPHQTTAPETMENPVQSTNASSTVDQTPDAAGCLNKALDLLNGVSANANAIVIRFWVFQYMFQLGSWERAIEGLNQVLEDYLLHPGQTPENIRWIMSELAECYYMTGDQSECSRILEKIRLHLDPNDQHYSTNLRGYAVKCWNLDAHDLALPILKGLCDNISKHTASNISVEDLTTEVTYANCLYQVDEYTSAVNELTRLVTSLEAGPYSEILEPLDCLRQKAEIMLTMARAFRKLDQSADCASTLKEAKETYNSLGSAKRQHVDILIDATMLSGEVYLSAEDLENAKLAFEEVVVMCSENSASVNAVLAKIFLACILFRAEDFAKCRQSCLEARNTCLESKSRLSGRLPREYQILLDMVDWLALLCLRAAGEWEDFLKEAKSHCSNLEAQNKCSRIAAIAALLTGSPWEYFIRATGLYLEALRFCFADAPHAKTSPESLAVLLDNQEAVVDHSRIHDDAGHGMLVDRAGDSVAGVHFNGRLQLLCCCSDLLPWMIYLWDKEGQDIFLTGNTPNVEDTSDHLLKDYKWRALLLSGNTDRLLTELPDSLRDSLVYNPPPESETWPRSWTCITDALPETDQPVVPLWIAGAPVILSSNHRYPAIPALIPPADPHPPISCGDRLDVTTAEAIFKEFDFAVGFALFLNGDLQMFLPEDYDVKEALLNKPRKFGGLNVEYTTLDSVRAAAAYAGGGAHPVQAPPLAPAPPIAQRGLRTNDPIEVRVRSRSGREGRASGRVGLIIRSRAQRPRHYLTIASHVLQYASSKWEKKASRLRAVFSSARSSWRGATVLSVPEPGLKAQELAHFSKQSVVYDGEGRLGDPPGAGYHHDVTLIEVESEELIAHAQAPVHDLGWISKEGWHSLRGSQGSQVKLLRDGLPNDVDVDVMTNKTEEFCSIIGEAMFRAPEYIQKCLIFRAPKDLDEPSGQSGTAVYSPWCQREPCRREDCEHVTCRVGPAVVGFVSFFNIAYAPGVRLKQSVPTNMRNREFQDALNKQMVQFWGAHSLPPDLVDNYDILCRQTVQERTEDSQSTDGTRNDESERSVAGHPAGDTAGIEVHVQDTEDILTSSLTQSSAAEQQSLIPNVSLEASTQGSGAAHKEDPSSSELSRSRNASMVTTPASSDDGSPATAKDVAKA